MQILSLPQFLLVGSNAVSVPLPPVFQNTNQQARFVLVKNVGFIDCTVNVGSTPGNAQASTSSQTVAAGQQPAIPGLWRNPTALAIGSVVTLPIPSGGALYVSALASVSIIDSGINQIGTASEGSSTITLENAAGVEVGMYPGIIGAGIANGTTVTAINGDTITISSPTTAALSNVTIDFGALANPQPPGLLCVALAA